jgi:hypothetical protein
MMLRLNRTSFPTLFHEEEECSCAAIQSRYADNGSYIGSSREHEQRSAVGNPEEECYAPIAPQWSLGPDIGRLELGMSNCGTVAL